MAAARRRRSLALPAVLVGGMIAATGATAVAAASAYGQGGLRRTPPAIATLPAAGTLPGHTAPDDHASRGSRTAPPGAGPLSGIVTLDGPTKAAPGTWVVFTLSGPGRMARTDATAPYQLTVDTRTLPDGGYTFSVVVLAPQRPPSVTARSVVILNHPAARPSTTRPASAAPPARPATGSTPATPVRGLSAAAAEVVRRTNVERARYGCGALRVSTVLTSVAQAHSADMASNNYFSHDSLSGASPFDRMAAAGYDYSTAGENIAAGQATPAEAVTAWMNSPGHRANILNCAFTEIGVGYATSASSRYGLYWTQDFGTPR